MIGGQNVLVFYKGFFWAFLPNSVIDVRWKKAYSFYTTLLLIWEPKVRSVLHCRLPSNQKGVDSIMSVEVKRKKGESFDALLRRFQRRYQQSGRGLQTKKIRFHKADPNRNKSRESALRRQTKKEQYEYQLKTGQLKEEPKRHARRH